VDAILLSNVLQTDGEERALDLLRKAWDAIRPGGTLLVHGVMPSASAPVAPVQALFAVRMYLAFDQGRAWSAEQVSEWLARENFAVRFTRPLGSPFHTSLIVASRLE
jgi:8-O-methyltransferase